MDNIPIVCMLVRLRPMVKHVSLVIATWSRIILTAAHLTIRLTTPLLLVFLILLISVVAINYLRTFIAMLSAPAFLILRRITRNTTR